MFPDKNVPHPFIDPTIPWDRAVYPEDSGIPLEHVSRYYNLTHKSDAKNGAALANHIYIDAKAFGGSCCCLQVTVQGYNIDQARRLYDAMVPLGPIMVSLLFSRFCIPSISLIVDLVARLNGGQPCLAGISC